MSEAFPDPMAKWTPAPNWSVARLVRPDWSATPLHGLAQILLTGDLEAALTSLDPRPASVGLWEIASRVRAAIRIGRDRALLVSSEIAPIATGWQAGGWAASDASDAYCVLSLGGVALREIVVEATSADLDIRSPSASILFAGVPALLYRLAEDEARLHVEASLAPYIWRWLETR